MRVLKKSASRSSDEEMESEAGTDQEAEDAFAPAPVFTELLELTEYSDGAREWKEVARWVKYEETVEEAGNRSDPFSSLGFNILICFAQGGASLIFLRLVYKPYFT